MLTPHVPVKCFRKEPRIMPLQVCHNGVDDTQVTRVPKKVQQPSTSIREDGKTLFHRGFGVYVALELVNILFPNCLAVFSSRLARSVHRFCLNNDCRNRPVLQEGLGQCCARTTHSQRAGFRSAIRGSTLWDQRYPSLKHGGLGQRGRNVSGIHQETVHWIYTTLRKWRRLFRLRFVPLRRSSLWQSPPIQRN